MSLSLVIAIIVIADVAIIGLLAFVMSRASLLRPHRSVHHAEAAAPAVATRRRQPAQAPRRARRVALTDRA